jgi:hypothetical protein
MIDSLRRWRGRYGRELVASTLLLLCHCSDPPAAGDAGPELRLLAVLDPPGPDVGLPPGEQRALRVRYTDAAGRAFPGARIQFAIFGDPRGSTLSADSVYTNEAGEAEVQIRAGAAVCHFEVRVTAEHAEGATFYLEVSNAGFGSLSIRAAYTGGIAEKDLPLVRYLLYLDAGQGCRALSPQDPPLALRERSTTALAEPVAFKALPINVDHAILAIASDAKLRPRAAGCVEIPRAVLKANRQLISLVELRDLPPTVVGRYGLSSSFVLPKPPQPGSRPIHDALQPLGDLTDCPLDPAQLLLDCMIDALGPAPHDCVPGGSPSPAAAALIEERGALDAKGCRGVLTPRGTVSLEQQLDAALKAGGATSMIESLQGLVASSEKALEHGFRLESELEILAVDPKASAAVASHRLLSLSFGPKGATSAVLLVGEIGLPSPLALPVTASLGAGWRLLLADHGFTLRFGRLAREAIGKLVLGPAGLPESSDALAQELVTRVQRQDAGTKLKGCAALSATACQAARLPIGCLLAACPVGTSALGSYLDAGFAAIAGTDTDFSLKGTVDLIDADGDLRVDALGTTEAPGSWDAWLKLGPEPVTPQTATFVGKGLAAP